MTPLVALTVGVILVFTPLSVLALAFMWQLHQEDPENGITLILAVQMATRTIAAVILTVPTVLFIMGIPVPWAGQVILVAIDLLLVSGVWAAFYLWRLRRRAR